MLNAGINSLFLPMFYYHRPSGADVSSDAGSPHELPGLHLQQQRHALHHGHLQTLEAPSQGEGAIDCGPVRKKSGAPYVHAHSSFAIAKATTGILLVFLLWVPYGCVVTTVILAMLCQIFGGGGADW